MSVVVRVGHEDESVVWKLFVDYWGFVLKAMMLVEMGVGLALALPG